MGHVQSEWNGLCRSALAGALGCCLLAGCTLVSRDGLGQAPQDAGTSTDVDAAAPGVTVIDGARPRSAAERPSRDDDATGFPGAEEDAGREDVPDASEPPEATVPPQDAADAGGGSDADAGADSGKPPPGAGMAPDHAGPPDPADANADDLIDAIDAQDEERTDLFCSCPGNAQQCSRAGFAGDSCEQWALSVLSSSSEAGALELLNCLLPAEEAYTECLDRELNCRSPEASLRGCSTAYQIATARCNALSVAGRSVQQLCSR